VSYSPLTVWNSRLCVAKFPSGQYTLSASAANCFHLSPAPPLLHRFSGVWGPQVLFRLQSFIVITGSLLSHLERARQPSGCCPNCGFRCLRLHFLSTGCTLYQGGDGGSAHLWNVDLFNETTWHCVPEGCHLRYRRRENLKSHIPFCLWFSFILFSYLCHSVCSCVLSNMSLAFYLFDILKPICIPFTNDYTPSH
jgi:hypothetical protein